MTDCRHPTGNYVLNQRLPLDFCLGENPWGCSPFAVDALQSFKPEDFPHYPDNFGKCFCQALGERYSLDPEWFCIGSGALGILDLIFRAFGVRNSKCVLPDVSFPAYRILARQHRIEITSAPMGTDLAIDLPEMCRCIRLAHPDFTILANPSNPTGKFLSRDSVERLIAATEGNGLLVIDEANVEFCIGSLVEWFKPKKWPDHLLSVRSFSKAHGLASQRVGYVIGRPKTLRLLMNAWIDFPVTQTALHAAVAAISDKAHLTESVSKMNDSRKMLLLGLEQAGLRVLPSDSNYLLVDLAIEPFNADELANKLATLGIGILSGSRFEGLGDRWVRISPRTKSENLELIKAISTIDRGACRDV